MNEFPESWAVMALSDAVSNITITDKKIPQKEYLGEGAYPVFDQGQDYIGGYTDKKETLVDCELPVIVFGDLPYGTYAAFAFHDADGNNELLRSRLGIPREPIGASNNAKGRFGPPTFTDAAFQLDEPLKVVPVTVNTL